MEGVVEMAEVVTRVGDEAPAIDTQTVGGGRFRLADERGRWVVLYFYVEAGTSL